MTQREMTRGHMAQGDASFAVTVQPGELHFNAAHFITLGGQCEPLHGHNFHVRVDVRGESDADAVVIDFVLLTRLAREACAALNDRVLLPGRSGEVRLSEADGMVEVSALDRRFILPADNCAVLPVSNTSAEMIAWHLSEELLGALRQRDALGGARELEVAVEEADRQWGICRRQVAP